jgi:hypothetical protein
MLTVFWMIPTSANHKNEKKQKTKQFLSLLGIGDGSGYRAFWIFGHSP